MELDRLLGKHRERDGLSNGLQHRRDHAENQIKALKLRLREIEEDCIDA